MSPIFCAARRFRQALRRARLRSRRAPLMGSAMHGRRASMAIIRSRFGWAGPMPPLCRALWVCGLPRPFCSSCLQPSARTARLCRSTRERDRLSRKTADLPPPLRVFREQKREAPGGPGQDAPLHIAFPPANSEVELPPSKAKRTSCPSRSRPRAGRCRSPGSWMASRLPPRRTAATRS